MTNVKTEKNKGGKKMFGVVVSNKMKDTAVVRVDRFVKHPKYGKFISIHKNFKAEDIGNKKSVGDKVTIMETVPKSADKHFKVI